MSEILTGIFIGQWSVVIVYFAGRRFDDWRYARKQAQEQERGR